MKEYDYLIVGAGLAGAMKAYSLTQKGFRCLVIDKNEYVGGFCYTEKKYGIDIHKYGAHVFRTNMKEAWDFVNRIAEFVPFTNSPVAMCYGRMYNLPFNMNTFNQLYGSKTPKEAMIAIEKDRVKCDSPKNLEEHVLDLVGEKLYRILVKEYTEKQWGKLCSELPPSIISRIPLRFTYDNNYYNELYQGVPKCGYTNFIEILLEGSDLRLGIDFFEHRELAELADRVIFTGEIDKYFDYKYGKLDYRSVDFVHIEYDKENMQGNAVINYTSHDVPYTRSIEHKHFFRNPEKIGKTIVSYEFPNSNGEPSYPINTKENMDRLAKYKELANREDGVEFFGRLAEYKYYSMNDIIEQFV